MSGQGIVAHVVGVALSLVGVHAALSSDERWRASATVRTAVTGWHPGHISALKQSLNGQNQRHLRPVLRSVAPQMSAI